MSLSRCKLRKKSNMNFIDVHIAFEMEPLRISYPVTLTSIFKVKITNLHKVVPADLPPLVRHPPSSWSCFCITIFVLYDLSKELSFNFKGKRCLISTDVPKSIRKRDNRSDGVYDLKMWRLKILFIIGGLLATMHINSEPICFLIRGVEFISTLNVATHIKGCQLPWIVGRIWQWRKA